MVWRAQPRNRVVSNTAALCPRIQSDISSSPRVLFHDVHGRHQRPIAGRHQHKSNTQVLDFSCMSIVASIERLNIGRRKTRADRELSPLWWSISGFMTRLVNLRQLRRRRMKAIPTKPRKPCLFMVRSPRGRRGVLSFFHVCVIFEASISCHVLQCFLLLRCIFCCFLLCFL